MANLLVALPLLMMARPRSCIEGALLPAAFADEIVHRRVLRAAQDNRSHVLARGDLPIPEVARITIGVVGIAGDLRARGHDGDRVQSERGANEES